MKFNAEVVAITRLDKAVSIHLQCPGAPCGESKKVCYDNNFFWHIPTAEAAKIGIGSHFSVSIEERTK